MQFWTAARAPAAGVVVDVIDLNEIARWPMGVFRADAVVLVFFSAATQIFRSNSVVTEDNDSWDRNVSKV